MMKVWKVVRNAEKNFTHTFSEVYGTPAKYKEPYEYNIVKQEQFNSNQTNWLHEVKNFHK